MMKKCFKTTYVCIFLAICMIACFILAGCNGKQGGEKQIENISLNETSITLDIGETFQLNATISPEDAENKDLNWSASPAGIVTVSDNGLVTAVAEGAATVTAASGNGKSADCSVTVKPYVTPDEQKFAASFNPGDYLSLFVASASSVDCEGQEATIRAVRGGQEAGSVKAVFNRNNELIVPLASFAGLTDQGTYQFEIATPFTAEVLDLTAELTAVEQNYIFSSEEGWQNSPNGEGELKANGRIAVVGEQTWGWVSKTITVDFDKASIVDVKIRNASHNWAVKVSGNGIATPAPLFPEGGYEGNDHHVVDLKSVAGMEKTTGVAELTFDFFASGALDAYTDMEYFRLIASEAVPAVLTPIKEFVALEDFAYAAQEIAAKMGETINLTEGLTFTPADASNRNLSFASSDEQVFTVDPNGVLTPVSVGQAELTMKSPDGTIVKTIPVDVRIAVEGMALKNSSGIYEVGNTFKIEPVFTPANATNQKVVYTVISGNATVAQDGTVTCSSAGESVIRVTAEDGAFTADFTLTVQEKVVHAESITVLPDTFDGKIGDTQQLTVEVLPENADDKSVIYSSSDAKVVTVSESGLMTITGYGSATVTATTNDGGKTDECAVTSYPYYDFENNTQNQPEYFYVSFEAAGTVTTDMRAAVDVYKGVEKVTTVTAAITKTSDKSLLKALFDIADFNMTEDITYRFVIRVVDEEGNAEGNGYEIRENLPLESDTVFEVTADGGWTRMPAPLDFDAAGNLVLKEGGETYGGIMRDVTINFDGAPYLVIKVDSAQTLWSIVFQVSGKDVKVTPDMAENEIGTYVIDLRAAEDIFSGGEELGDRTGIQSVSLRIFLNRPGTTPFPEGGFKTKIASIGFYREKGDFEFSLNADAFRLVKGESAQISASVENGAEGHTIAYQSNAPEIVSVGTDGKLTANAPGFATVTVSYMVDGAALVTKSVKVYVGGEFVYSAEDELAYAVAADSGLVADTPVVFEIYSSSGTFVGQTTCTVESYGRVAASLAGIAMNDGESYRVFLSAGNKAVPTEFNLVSAVEAKITADGGWTPCANMGLTVPEDGKIAMADGVSATWGGFLTKQVTINMSEMDYMFWKVEAFEGATASIAGFDLDGSGTKKISYNPGWGITGDGIAVAAKSQVASADVGANEAFQAMTGEQTLYFCVGINGTSAGHAALFSMVAAAHIEINFMV